MTAYAAYLRVYEPLAAFEPEERRTWRVYAAAGRGRPRTGGADLEHEAALRAVSVLPPSVPDLGDEAFVTEVDGVVLVCPWRTALRSWEAVVTFSSGLPEEVSDAFLPRPVVDDALDALEAWRRQTPGLRSHILTSTWQVPLSWLVLVDPEERTVELGDPVPRSGGVRAGRELVYRTPMSRARRRAARALALLRRTVDDAEMPDLVEDVARWLEEFHPRSLVELDYGGLVHLLDDAELRLDESARDVAGALAALSEGELSRATAGYTRVVARMKALQAVESAN